MTSSWKSSRQQWQSRILEEKLEGVREVVVEGGEQLLVEGQGVQLVDSRRRAGFVQPMRKIFLAESGIFETCHNMLEVPF